MEHVWVEPVAPVEAQQPDELEHEGERYLNLLGLGHLAQHTLLTKDGTIQARDFLEVCGNHARPLLVGFESLGPEDPRYETMKAALQGYIGRFIQGENPSS